MQCRECLLPTCQCTAVYADQYLYAKQWNLDFRDGVRAAGAVVICIYTGPVCMSTAAESEILAAPGINATHEVAGSATYIC